MSEPDYLRQTGEWAGDDARPLVCEQWNSRHQRSAPEPEPAADAVEAVARAIAKVRYPDKDPGQHTVGGFPLWHYFENEARAALSALPRPSDLEREERAHGETIDQRDAAESALSEAYLIVTGEPPEWSNRFGYREALDDIRGALPRPAADEGALRLAIKLIKDCQADLARYLEPLPPMPAKVTISHLLARLDGPQWREVEAALAAAQEGQS